LTGDYINGIFFRKGKRVDDRIDRFNAYIDGINAGYGIYATFGNIDWGYEEKIFRKTKIVPLRNRKASIKIRGTEVNILGIDHYSSGLAYKLVERHLNPAGLNILLYHSPDISENVAEAGSVDLFLTGHTHGGQINIPFLREFALRQVSKLGHKYRAGEFKLNGMTMYVNRGLGVEGESFPSNIRMFCKPEIAFWYIGKKEAISIRDFRP
jgi:hypothetical protein